MSILHHVQDVGDVAADTRNLGTIADITPDGPAELGLWMHLGADQDRDVEDLLAAQDAWSMSRYA